MQKSLTQPDTGEETNRGFGQALNESMSSPRNGQSPNDVANYEDEESSPEQYAHSVATDDIEVLEIGFSKTMVMLVSFFMFVMDILINVDHGALPAASVFLKKDLDLDSVKLGILGSLVFGGLVCGSICATFFVNRLSYKTILSVSFLGNGIGLLTFTMTNRFLLLSLTRFFSGFFQIFLTIYVPLYVDTYGTHRSKPCMLSLIMVGPPLGVVFGYGLTATAIELFQDWRTSFFIQGLSMAVSFFIMVIIPDKYINIDEAVQMKREEKKTKNLLLEHE